MSEKEREIGDIITKMIRNNEIRQLEGKILELKGDMPIGISSLNYPWSSTSEHNCSFSKPEYFDDPICGCIILEPKLLPIFYHPIVGRLRYINQLAFAFASPSATHTRLSHSLGVVYLMEQALTKIFKKNQLYSETEITSFDDLSKTDETQYMQVAKISALLHDIGHGPFSHTIDRYVGFHKNIIDYPDKRFSFEYLQTYLKPIIEEVNLNYEAISSILDRSITTKSGYYQLISNILDSPLDVDRLDYLSRDSHFSGIPVGTLNVNSLIESMVPYKEEENGRITISLAFLERAMPYIKHFLFARSSMYSFCYEDPLKLAAERMIVKAVDNLKEEIFKGTISLDYLKLLTDQQLINFILINSDATSDSFKIINAIMRGEILKPQYTIDISKWIEQEKKPIGVQEFLDDFRKKTRKTTYIDRVRNKEKEICEECGFKPEDYWKIAIYYPPPEAMIATEIGIRIIRKKNSGFEVVELGDDPKYSEIQDLFKLIRNERLKIHVFCSPMSRKEDRQKVSEFSRQIYDSI